MHTYDTDKVTFHYNSDFSGNIIICNEHNHIEIPAKHILEFVFEKYIKSNFVDWIENLSLFDLRHWLWIE